MSDTNPDANPDVPPLPPVKQRWPVRALVYVTFWSWHAIWALCLVFGMVPHLLPDLIGGTFEGVIPWGITLTALALTVLPFFTALGGIRLHGDHRRVFRFFFGVGGVAGALLLVRLFFIREATFVVDYILATLAIGVAFYAVDLFSSDRDDRPGLAIARVVGGSSLLMIGVYTAVTAVLYAVPLIALAVPAFFEALWELLTSGNPFQVIGRGLLGLLFFSFAIYTLGLLLGLPIVVAILYPRAWWRAVQRWSKSRPRGQAIAITAAVVTLWTLGFAWSSTQPQREALQRTSTRLADLQAQRENAENADSIGDGLLNAYLARYRYWGVTDDNVHLARLYGKAFHASGDVMAPQWLFNRFASPILYDGGNLMAARAEAEVRYEQFFDAPIQERDREAVLAAVAATYDRDRAEAGLLDVGRRRVLHRAQAESTTGTSRQAGTYSCVGPGPHDDKRPTKSATTGGRRMH